jgi:DNA-binding NarL/FixJ family response regulator
MSAPLSILVVDDHRIFAEGLIAVLRLSFPDAVFSMATSGEMAADLLESAHQPDLVVTDISMGGMSGLQLASLIKSSHPAIRVLILSMHDDAPVIQSALDTEAEGFVLKSASAADIAGALRDILAGRTHYSREVLDRLVQSTRRERKSEEVRMLLSEREKEVLTLILQEYSSDDIAEKLFISKRTVDTHRANILEKTGCRNLIALYKFAVRNGLIDSLGSTA